MRYFFFSSQGDGTCNAFQTLGAAHSRPAGYLQASILSAFARTINLLPRQEEELHPSPRPPPPNPTKKTHLPLFVVHWDPPSSPLAPGGLLTLSLTQKTSTLDPKFRTLYHLSYNFFFVVAQHSPTELSRTIKHINPPPPPPPQPNLPQKGWRVGGSIANA